MYKNKARVSHSQEDPFGIQETEVCILKLCLGGGRECGVPAGVEKYEILTYPCPLLRFATMASNDFDIVIEAMLEAPYKKEEVIFPISLLELGW